MSKGYLFGSIFYDKDKIFNEILALGIRQAWPGIDLYVPQEATFNNKKTFADSKMIYDGDYERLKKSDLLIGCLDGDLPPIGSVTELGIFSELAKNNPDKHIIVLLTDTRDSAYTLSQEKIDDMKINQASSQFSYFNLFTKGVIENSGVIVRTTQQLFEYIHQLYLCHIKNNHISGIYKITNRLNNKSYIGKSIDIYNRWKEHYTKNIQEIDMAIYSDGIENFTLEILEKCPVDILTEREKFWTNEYFKCSTYIPNGYNVGLAGSGGAIIGKVVSCYDLDGNLIKTFPSLHEAGRYYHVDATAIFQALNNNNLSNKMQWKYGAEQHINKYIDSTCKPCYITNLFGDKIKDFLSYTEAALWLEIKASTVTNAIKNQFCIKNKYYAFDSMTEKNEDFFINKYPKTIYCYNKTDRFFLKEYENLSIAAKELNIDRHKITWTCQGSQYYCGNYIMSYLKYDRIPANFKELNKEYYNKIKKFYKVTETKYKNNTIFKYDKETKMFLQEYSNFSDIEKEIEKFRGGNNIKKALNGKISTAYGFIWSYCKWEKAPEDYQYKNKQNSLLKQGYDKIDG